jgi:SET domain-containing protein
MKGLHQHITIGTSAFGKGVFATRNLKAGSVICHVTGPRITFADTLQLGKEESYAVQIDHDSYLLCQPPFVYTNHSCFPNCGVNHRLQMLAMYDIEAGEELFWDYSTSMLERHWTMSCACGHAQCRKHITDFDLLEEHLQLYYLERNLVLPFIVQHLRQQWKRTA